jgi:hypothetical protein
MLPHDGHFRRDQGERKGDTIARFRGYFAAGRVRAAALTAITAYSTSGHGSLRVFLFVAHHGAVRRSVTTIRRTSSCIRSRFLREQERQLLYLERKVFLPASQRT